jgi:N-acetylmuramoyl-L-alanine amidase
MGGGGRTSSCGTRDNGLDHHEEALDMKVCVDAGHGGSDPGAVGTVPFDVEEQAVNLAVAGRVEAALEERGHWVVMTRRQDRTLSTVARADFANRLGADLFVSVHANAAASPHVEGMEVYHFPGSGAGQHAAHEIRRQLAARFPDHRDRGVKEANFTVLRRTWMPAVLVECEFLTNPQQLVFLTDPDNQQRLADEIAAGVDRWATW